MPATKATTPNLFTGDPLLGDAGRFPPTLTDAGRKLRPTWITQVLEGKKRYRAYLDTRMPLYGMANVGHLPDLFAQAHQAPEITHPPENHLTEGHQLVGTSGGMGCITCHAWQENLGVAMHGPSISAIGERLHFDWFKAYLIDPQRIRPNTLMPSFWPEGKSGNPNVLDGKHLPTDRSHLDLSQQRHRNACRDPQSRLARVRNPPRRQAHRPTRIHASRHPTAHLSHCRRLS